MLRRTEAWLSLGAAMVVVVPLLVIGVVSVVRIWHPLSTSDRALLCAAVVVDIAVLIVVGRTGMRSSIARSLLIAVPTSLAIYPLTHTLSTVLGGILGACLPHVLGAGRDRSDRPGPP